MKRLLLAALFALPFQGRSQAIQSPSFNDMIAKTWKLEYYGDNGTKMPPSPEQKQDRMIFYKDYRVVSIEMGKTQQATWKYDTATKRLTVIDNQSKGKTDLQVLKLDQQRCVLSYKDPAGSELEIHMLAVEK
ncbi:hypothetical protein [Chitinophaga rhizophila]|uniref:Lipocalin-like domain-containing protein n=1 Tax=Chitinophaga rhizophila TaxID=2866212 RepID=A0ABS7GJI3_9BACT|nr:hypothetical protein [Chitinophaga rhizophila]MBW8687859.1 hypothetical protein [Chitinophaga rhizophila]